MQNHVKVAISALKILKLRKIVLSHIIFGKYSYCYYILEVLITAKRCEGFGMPWTIFGGVQCTGSNAFHCSLYLIGFFYIFKYPQKYSTEWVSFTKLW